MASSKSSPNLSSANSNSPTKDLNKKDSFQYWKQKDISSQISYSPSTPPDGASPPPSARSASTPTSPSLSANNKSKSQSSIQITTSKVGNVSPPFTSPALPSTKLASASTPSTTAPTPSTTTTSTTTTPSKSKTPVKSTSSTQTDTNNAASNSSGLASGSQTLPSRMKAEGRKSIKSIFSLVWSGKPEESEEVNNNDAQQPQTQPTQQKTQETKVSSSKTTTSSISKPASKPSSKSSSSISTLKPSVAKSSTSSSSQGTIRKSSTSSTMTSTSTSTSTSSSTTSTPSNASPSTQSPALAAKKPAPSLPPRTYITDSNSTSSTSSAVQNNDSNDITINDLIDQQINKLKNSGLSDAERMLQFELVLSKTMSTVEDLSQRLAHEVMNRRELESYCNELEARLTIAEARLKRYAESSGNTGSTELEVKENQMVQRAIDSRDDTRFNTLNYRVETFESRIRGLEENNQKITENLSTVQFEQSIFTSEKRKKALKKLEREKGKEKEQRERDLKDREKERLRSAKKEKKEREREYKRQFMSDSRSDRSQMTDYSANDISDSDTDTCASEASNLKSSLKDTTSDLVAPSPKKVGFASSDQQQPAHPKSKSTGSYTTSLRKWAGKRMSAHVPSTTDMLEDKDDGELVNRLERANTTAERSNLTKGYFTDYYENAEDLRNMKLTRMRSKSLSRDGLEDEEPFQPPPKVTLSVSTGSTSQPTKVTSSNSSQSSPSLQSLVSSQQDEDKKKQFTIGRMFSKKEKMMNGDKLKVSMLLSERLNQRASRDELIIKKIMKAESIFAINVTEDTLDRLLRFLENCFDMLSYHADLEDLFTRKVEESAVRSFKESIEQSIVSDFTQSDPYLVAATLLCFFESIPDPLLGKAFSALNSIVYIEDIPFRKSLTRSILLSLPPTHRSILKPIIQFIQSITNHQPTPPMHPNHHASIPVPMTPMDPPQFRLDDSPSTGNSTPETPAINSGSTTTSPTELSSPSTPLATAQVVKPKSKLTLYALCATFSKVLYRNEQKLGNSGGSAINNADREVLSFLNIIQDFDKHFDSQPNIQFIIKDISYVKSATFEKLFERLIDLNNRDTDYNYTIFYTYDYYFKSPTDFLELMVYYFKKTVPLDESAKPKPWQTELSLTVLSVGMFWMKLHHKHLYTDLMFRSKLKSFIDLHAPKAGSPTSNFFNYFKSFFQLTAPVKTLYERGNSFYSTVKKTSNPAIKIKDENDVDIYQIGAPIIASQMTIIDLELFTSIPHLQFLHKAFTKPELSPEFHQMVDRFNQWARWTSTEILSKEKVQDRATSISYFIDVAKSCVEIGNFNCAAAIIGGLNHSSISRLKNTWDKISAKTLSDYKSLEVLFDMSMNYKNYREALKASTNKVVPYLAIYPKDLIAIEEANDTFTANGMINIEKFRLIYRIVKELQLYHQVSNLKFQLIEPIKKYIINTTAKLSDEKELHAQSLKVEPRQPAQ